MNIYSSNYSNSISYLLFQSRANGIREFIRLISDSVKWRKTWACQKLFSRNQYFKFNDQTLTYNNMQYNKSALNERSIEIPIIKYFLKRNRVEKVLELGSVLPYYMNHDWTVLDKFEITPGVINQDIIDYRPKAKFDLIISISTLEHIGYDDDKLDKNKIFLVIKHIQKHVINKSGSMISTFPLGYNPYLDQLIFSNKNPFSTLTFLKRISQNNSWKQIKKPGKAEIRYNHPYNNANFICVAQL